MNKLVAATSGLLAVGVAVLGLAMAPAAAADETGPDSVACAQANAAVLQAALKANAVADTIQAGQDQVIKDLKAKVDAAQAVYDKAYAAYQADPDADTLAVLVKAQSALDAALDALKNAPGVPADQKAKLAAAQAELKAAIERRVKACDFVTLPTVTVTPSPSVTVTPAPRVTGIDTGLA